MFVQTPLLYRLAWMTLVGRSPRLTHYLGRRMTRFMARNTSAISTSKPIPTSLGGMFLFMTVVVSYLTLDRCAFLLSRFTVPVLWDRQNETIVNNESSEIIRMFNTAFNDQIPEDKASLDLYPTSLRGEIDEINKWVYDTVNSTFAFYQHEIHIMRS